MAKKLPELFEAKDGVKFKTQAEAERHEAMVDAKQTFQAARRRWTKALTETHKTADGADFVLNGIWDYWYVRQWAGQMPYVVRVSFSLWDCTLDDSDRAEIWVEEGTGSNRTRQCYCVAELYRHHGNANKALAVELKAFRDELSRRIREIEEGE